MTGTSFDIGILRRILGRDGRELPPEVARFFLSLSLTDEDHQRIDALSEKANEGELSDAEREQLSMYVLLGDFLAIMQSQARMSMKSKSPAA